MTTRMKPILGMWATLILLSVAMQFLMPQSMVGIEPVFGLWPSMIVVWLIVALFFDWVIQSTGMRFAQAAVVLALTGILATSVGPWMFEGLALSVAAIDAVVTLVFWYASATVYGKLSH